MTAAVRVGGGMAGGRAVAAANVAALEADAQMQPGSSLSEAVLAPVDGFGQLRDEHVIEVGAGGHWFTS
jgi:hypothetical protein